MERILVDASSGGDVFRKTPQQTRQLFNTIATNSQHFGTHQDMQRDTHQKVSEAVTSSLESQLKDITSFVQKLAMGQTPQVMVYGICETMGHSTDMCKCHRRILKLPQQTIWLQKFLQFKWAAKSQYELKPKTIASKWIETRTSINNLKEKVGDIVISLSKLASRGKLPSQTEKNPNVNAVTLRSVPKNITYLVTPIATQPPFPSRLATSKKNAKEKEIMETLRKVEGNEKILMNNNASVVLQRKLSLKCKDPGMFTIPCKIWDVTFSSSILDLSASINFMPYSAYELLNVGPLNETGVIISLADKSSVFLNGVLEDVLL
ncbi:uncharacterized protein LOC111886772 [Lactuca sativa]|uniref:uncharacterized protein LOC111886772 n=1 Tax=Lactuca sativa TaxID=4236 RepID=UPI000CD8CAFA|nr:uncharacterized protein LOC111886772 [Lactuca sativa]